MDKELADKIRNKLRECGIERKVMMAALLKTQNPEEMLETMSFCMAVISALLQDGSIILKERIKNDEDN